VLTPEKIAELQMGARAQPLDQQHLLYSMLQKAEKHGMAEPGMSEKFKPQQPEPTPEIAGRLDEVGTASEEELM
jgi:hypothetical protein